MRKFLDAQGSRDFQPNRFNVRFWHLADINADAEHVRYWK